MSKKMNLGGFLTGATIGAGLAFLFAPNTGAKTRRDLKRMMDDMLAKINEVDIDEVKTELETKLAHIKAELETLDSEKVSKMAKKKAKELQEKADELVAYAVKKGTPALERAANVVREQVTLVAEEVIDRLNKEGK